MLAPMPQAHSPPMVLGKWEGGKMKGGKSRSVPTNKHQEEPRRTKKNQEEPRSRLGGVNMNPR
eukprot:1196146-Prorocentrum_minimum.AAC.4